MTFVKNAWYMAAWGEEVSRTMLARTLLGVPVVLYRRENGAAVALSDRCPHRAAPLHLGVLLGDDVRCPYHGLRFDCAGACVDNPHGERRIPPLMRLASYPLVERHSILWIWMGDAPANEALLPDYAALDLPHRTMRRLMRVASSYLLVLDNILDLSHIVFVHAGGIGGTDMLAGESHEVVQKGTQVWSKRQNKGIRAAPAYRSFQPAFETVKADKHQSLRWDPPGSLLLEIVHHEHGEPERHRITNYSAQLLTPETESSTHYFWSVSRDHDLDSAKLDEAMVAAVERAFVNEDKPIIEAQQRMLDTTTGRQVLLDTDAAATSARRVLDQLLARES